MRTVQLILALALLPVAAAWPANPELTAQVQGIDDESKQSTALRLASLEFEIDIAGALADITMTARFANPSEDILEGEFAFDLPESAVVTGYALDIEGRLLDGVLVEELKATRTYEKQVRQGIDPGVTKISRANRFTTWVFPIPSEGSRTIRLKFSAPIHAAHGLAFPLVTKNAVDEARFTVRSRSLRAPPALTLPNKLAANWKVTGDDATTRVRVGAAPLSGELRIAPVQPLHRALVSRHANGERRMHILDSTARPVANGQTGRRLRVYWDRSLSRATQSLEQERALLGKYLAQSKPSAIDLVVFNSSGARVRRVTVGEIDTALRGVLYRGATSFAVLEKISAPEADVCLVFTDGVATIDARRDFDPGCELFAITSAADADRGFLRRLVGGVSGAVLQLRTQGEAEVLARLMGGGPRVIQARGENGRALRFTTLDGGVEGWSVITEVPATGEVILRIAGLGGDAVERRYPVAAVKAGFDAAGALWAADRAARLSAEDGAHEAFVELSRSFSIASPGLSFLVLEEAEDYVEHEIAPPANYPAEWREGYLRLEAEHREERAEAKARRLGEVRELWQEAVAWWQTDFDPRAPKKEPEKNTRARMIAGVASAPAAGAAAPASSEINAIAAEDIGRFPDGNTAEALQRSQVEEVLVTGFRASMLSAAEMRRAGMVAVSSIGVELADWNIARPYLDALNAAAAEEVDRVLAIQERKYGSLPAFYFDVAEWLHRKQRTAEALEMLLSALELPVANEETVSMVAERLLRYGRADRAVWLLERAAEQTDYLPQPRRTLALALVKRAETAGETRARADLNRAVKLLDEVIMTPWEDDYDGIELVSLMEANALLPRLQALGEHEVPLHPSLRALLDVDLRVVIEWNTGATDMDLWVDEPNGERAIYSNARTAIGGRLSNDMTAGYGPEEYLLRRAAQGEYRISVHVYGSDAINPNGTTVVTAKLFRDFGRPNQAVRTMEIELLPDDEGEKLIGKFTVQ